MVSEQDKRNILIAAGFTVGGILFWLYIRRLPIMRKLPELEHRLGHPEYISNEKRVWVS